MTDPTTMTATSRLPAPARRMALAVALGATVLAGVTVVLHGGTPLHWLGVAGLAAGITCGEVLRVDLPYRRGGNASFDLSDAALAAGLLVLGPVEVVVASVIAMTLWQAIERVAPIKLAFNVAHYVAGAAAAALAVDALAPRPGAVDLQAFGAVALGMGLFLVVNVVSVGGVIAFTSGRSWWRTVQGILAPTGALLAVGTLGLGLLVVLVHGSAAWALPALGVPVVLLYTASRDEVRAQVDRERSAGFVELEQRLGETTDPQRVCELVAAGAETILGCNAAVWRDGAWATPVPEGSRPCPVDAELTMTLVARGPALGPNAEGQCAAIGLGGGVLVVWPGELGVGRAAEEWVDRLGRSGRVHFARVDAAVALEQERATLRAVVDGTADGIFVTSDDGTIRLWNPAMARLSGVPSDAAVGMGVREVLGEGDWCEGGVRDVVRVVGERVWRLSVSAVVDADQESLYVAVIHDVSAERRVTKMKDDMLAVVSHELRTPLTPIKASAQLLRQRHERLSAERRDRLLAQIEERADHLARLVGDLLLVGSLSAGSRQPVQTTPVPVDLADAVRVATAHLQLTYPSHDIEVQAPASLPGTTDPTRLRQIIDNLVDNACKFSPAGAAVDLLLCREGDDAVLRVIDRGRGIPSEDIERVFELFERVEDPLVMTTSGAGLGLYIVRALTAALGGTVQINSVVGQGSTVTIRLPLVAVRSEAAGATGPLATSPPDLRIASS
jgi:PAS domain S-box-containing protein